MNSAKTSTEHVHTPIVNGLLWLTAVHLAVCAAIFLFWCMAGDNDQIELFFQYQGSLFFMVFATAECVLAWCGYRQFGPGEPLRIAWLLIALSSFYRAVGYLFSQILCAETYLNPVFVLLGPQESSFYETSRRFGLLVSGPISMAVMAAGLYVILRVLRRVGILSRLRAIDFVLFAGVAAFTARQGYEILAWLRTGAEPDSLYQMLAWASDPLLSILLFEAILIRRSAIQTGWGLIAKSWGAFSLGILFTSLGNIGLWATTNHWYIPWPYSSITWYVWFLASAAYALGPAFQVEACRRAYREADAVAASKSPTMAE